MSDDNKHNEDERAPKKGGEFKVPPRTWIVWIAIFGGIILLMLFRDRMESQGEVLSQFKFQQLVESNQIAAATINYNPQDPFLTEIAGKYYKTDSAGNRVKKNDADELVTFRAKARLIPELEKKVLSMAQFEVRAPNTMLLSVVWSVL